MSPITLNPVDILKGIRQLHRLIIEEKIDVVHCHHRMAALYMRAYNLFYKMPVVYTLHLADVPSDFFHRSMTFFGDQAIGVSTEVCQFMTDKLKIPRNKINLVLNGVDPEQLKPLSDVEKNQVKKSLGIEENKIIVALHSRIDPMKNQMLMVEAVHQLPDDVRKTITVVCSGKKEGDYYRKVIEKIGGYAREEESNSTCKFDTPRIDKIFHFVGWCETRNILGVSDLLILPCTNDGFALSILEAFHMKVLTARTKTPGFYDQKYCIPISAENPKDIVNLLTDICRNGFSGYTDQIQKAYQYANAELTVKRMAEHTVEVYRKARGCYGG